MMRLLHLPLLLFLCFNNNVLSQSAAALQLPVPSAAQARWHETEFYLFFHFGPNTFTNLEWGHGTEPEDVFNPTALDCDQWCRVAKAAGARGVVITAKHHDGFCLWPSKYSTHTVRESKWRDGKGDILRELSDACRRHGLLFGVYLSPWDRNHPKYGTPEYNDVYINTLTELLTSYGDLFELWWDGANGEGPNGRKQVYDFHRFEQVAARLQPDAVIFSDIGPGCRWAGNERGLIETETNWCTLDTAGFRRGEGGPPAETLNRGNENGALWIPAECDVSIRPGWFYHPEEDEKVKTPAQLFDIYLKSVGRGANLILNVPPDRAGRIHAQDSAALVSFGKLVRKSFRVNLAAKAVVSREGGNCNFYAPVDPKALFDNDVSTNLPLSPCGSTLPLLLKFKKSTTFNSLLIREAITKGQRVREFKVEVWQRGQWHEIAHSNTIGPRKILTFPAVRTGKVRITVLSEKAAPILSEIGIFRI